MFTHTYSSRLATSSGDAVNLTLPITGEVELNLDVDIAGSATNQHVLSVALNVSKVASFALYADKALDVYTNAASGGSPANHFAVPANFPLEFIRSVHGTWKDTAGTTVGTDITSLFVTNADPGVVTLRLRSLSAAE